MVSKRMRCLALISHNNMKPAMQARLLALVLRMHMHMHMHMHTHMHMHMHKPPV